MTTVAGRMYGARPGSTCFRPSSAESTEIAGVIMASPENSAEPATPEKKCERRPPSERALGQRHQRQHAALALVVGPHQEQHVFDGDDDQSAQMISETTPMTSAGASAAPLNWPRAVCRA